MVRSALSTEDLDAWQAALARTGVVPLAAHAAYLINLGSQDQALWQRSVDALVDELQRCEMLGIPFLVFHPGAHGTARLTDGLKQIVKGIDAVHRGTRGLQAKLLLETTAGQGTAIGYCFEHLNHIRQAVRETERLEICVDTCHIFAAGYPLIRPDRYESTVQLLAEVIGLEHIKCLHVNDSKRGLGSRVDRHDHIGAGQIGLGGFRNLVNDARLAAIPKILETPKGLDDSGRDWDVRNLETLRRLVRRRAQ